MAEMFDRQIDRWQMLADRVEAEREALQASLQEAGESALHVAEELASRADLT